MSILSFHVQVERVKVKSHRASPEAILLSSPFYLTAQILIFVDCGVVLHTLENYNLEQAIVQFILSDFDYLDHGQGICSFVLQGWV